MLDVKRITSLVLVLLILMSPQISWADVEGERTSPPRWSYLIPLGNVLATNLVTWAGGRYLLQEDYAYINLDTMAQNFRDGFEWDNDGFRVNHLGHPYQGAHYHTGARAIGLNFWASLPFTILGSLKWEMLMENTRPAYNDVIFTVIGGPIVGEILFRLSKLLIDESTNGLGRIGREAMAGLFSPIFGLNRSFTGASRMNGDPPGRPPVKLELALQTSGVQDQPEAQRFGMAGLSAHMRYGEIAKSQSSFRPFDHFDLDLGFDYNHGRRFYSARLDTTGWLAKWNFHCGEGRDCALGPIAHFDYYESPAYKISTTAIGASLLGEGQLPFWAMKFRGGLEVGAIPLGAFDSSYVDVEDRDYNFSAGGLVRLNLELKKSRWFRLRGRTTRYYGYAFYGAKGADQGAISDVELEVPISDGVGVAVGASAYQREERPKGFEALTRRVLEIQAKLRWRLR